MHPYSPYPTSTPPAFNSPECPPASPQAGKTRQRSSRACDQCRKLRTRCNRTSPDDPCVTCVQRSLSCTSEGPEHKRGPPRGYLHALEDRLQGAEALLGVFLSLPDRHVQRILGALTQDREASEILGRVDHSAFGPSGRKLRSWLIDAVDNSNNQMEFKRHTRLGLANDSASPLVTRKVNFWQDELIALISRKLDTCPQSAQAGPSLTASTKSPVHPSPTFSPGHAQPVFYAPPSGVSSEPGRTGVPVDYASSDLEYLSNDSHGSY